MTKYILGLNAIGINTSAAILKDNKVVAAVEEERLIRQKKTRNFPENSIDFCLNQANIKISDLDCIAISWNPLINLQKYSKTYKSNLDYLPNILHSSLNHLIKNQSINEDFMSQNVKINNKQIEIFFIRHHLSHASNAYFSNFKNAAILTTDAFGENESSVFYNFENNKIQRISSNYFPHSLGSFYSTFTEFCGFKPQNEEWKLMGASAYSKNEKTIKKIRNLVEFKKNGSFELNLNYFNHYQFHRPNYYNNNLIDFLGVKPNVGSKNDKLNKVYYDIANAAQTIFEEIYFHKINFLRKKTKKDNLVVSGGSALNCLANGKIINKTGFKKLFISPVPDDSGAGLGAAAFVYKNFIGKRNFDIKNYYLGPKTSSNEVLTKLKKYQLKFKKINNIEKHAAKSISEGKVIGWFQDKLEFGDRALGNRSILADPRNKKMKKIVNEKIKYREKFRPFAPSVLEEEASNYFENYSKSDYMEITLKVKKNKQKIIPAVTHVDNTARLQTVSKQFNKKFYNLILEFNKITGVPVVLNTSFNIQGEPIVCSIEDSIKNFFLSGLDLLYIDNFLIEK